MDNRNQMIVSSDMHLLNTTHQTQSKNINNHKVDGLFDRQRKSGSPSNVNENSTQATNRRGSNEQSAMNQSDILSKRGKNAKLVSKNTRNDKKSPDKSINKHLIPGGRGSPKNEVSRRKKSYDD